jgi:CRP-like cAMP-binding protein
MVLPEQLHAYENDQARWFYVLLKGSVDLYFAIDVGIYPVVHKEIVFDTVHPGEILGISALIPPNIFTSSARTPDGCDVMKIDAAKLSALCQKDVRMAYKFIHQVAKVTIERLHATRLQLATAWVAAQTVKERQA